jgi:hypothetical protein
MSPEGTSYETMYQGTYGPLDSESKSLFIGYRIPTAEMSLTTDPTTAAQINEVTTKLSSGVRGLEVEGLDPHVFESIPKQHLEEIRQLGKLTGADITLHGPMIDPAGFSEGGMSETNRVESERQMMFAMERAHELNPNGGAPVTFHASVGRRGGAGVESTRIRPLGIPPEEELVIAVNMESGGMDVVRRERRTVPEPGKGEFLEPQEQLNKYNERTWAQRLSNAAYESMIAGGRMEEGMRALGDPLYNEIKSKKIGLEELPAQSQAAYSMIEMGEVMYDNVLTGIERYYNEADRLWKNARLTADSETLEKLEKQKENIERIKRDIIEVESKKLLEKNPHVAIDRISDAIRTFNEVVKAIPPQTYSSTDDVALQKSKETIANVALHAYKKYGDKAPAMCMENIFPGTVFSTGSELAKLIKASREQFVKRAQEEGYSAGEAANAADKLIGATWDTGHMFMMRKYGYSKEKTIEETKNVAPFVKHVHISDNFGYEHTELPPGMGDVPIKEMLTELEKAGYSGKKIIEAGDWWRFFKSSPMPYMLEALGSPIYGMQMQPFWNQARAVYSTPAPYNAGYGTMLPEQNFSLYGGGFAALPTELGGAMPGKGQRFSGTPME